MTSYEPGFIVVPTGEVVVVRLEEADLLDTLHRAREQVASGRAVCALLVRTVAPRYCVLHLEDIESLLARFTEPGASHGIEADVAWRPGAADPETALAETAIEVDGAIVAVAVAAARGPEAAMAAPADDEGFEAVPMTAPPIAPQPAEVAPVASFTRTPHIDVDQPEPVSPGQTFDASVYLDTQGFRPGEHGDQAVFEGEEALLDVYLYATPHFRVLGSSQEKLFIERSKPKSARLAFSLAVRSAAEIQSDPSVGLNPAQGTISALFLHDGRPCGRVHRSVTLAVTATATGAGAVTASADRFEVDTTARRADLQITIVADPINNGRQFHCVAYSPRLNKTVESSWNFNDLTSAIVAGYMHRFTRSGLGNAQRLAALRGAGVQLFEAAPRNFKHLFWEMVDDPEILASFKTIGICSEDPYIPWELMVPHRTQNGRRVTRDPLGVEFAIGRSTRKDLVAPPQHIDVSHSLVIAPNYPGRRRLEQAEEEADMICRSFGGRRLTPAVYAQLAVEFQRPESRNIDLIHFACHGEAESADGQIIYLEQDEQLSSIDVAGHEGFEQLFAQARPLVFMNACEVGRPVSALVGIGGFADVFLDLGAKAVIAPLWSVKDTVAHEIATTFYTDLQNARDTQTEQTFAEILRDIRARAYTDAASQGEDTYAAYCFYGDPLARLER